MVFALLIAAILWNLGTWWFGLPASSSHTMVGSIIGVGVANQLMSGTPAPRAWTGSRHQGLQGAADFAGCRLWLGRAAVPALQGTHQVSRALRGAEGQHASAVADSRAADLTCTGVSFFHGSNDGQKGMGLIMLILIGTVPTAYALNHAVTGGRSGFIAASEQAGKIWTSTWTRPASWAPTRAPR
jgi:PiT family inorganic phosphate transporter